MYKEIVKYLKYYKNSILGDITNKKGAEPGTFLVYNEDLCFYFINIIFFISLKPFDSSL